MLPISYWLYVFIFKPVKKRPLGKLYVDMAKDDMKYVCKIAKASNIPITEIKRALILQNYTIFYVYLTLVHFNPLIQMGIVDASKRDEFMDLLNSEALAELKIIYPDLINKTDYYSASINLWKKYMRYKKSFPEENESPLNTLFWEFGKWIALILSPNYDKDYAKVVNNNYEITSDMHLDLGVVTASIASARAFAETLLTVNKTDNKCKLDKLICVYFNIT